MDGLSGIVSRVGFAEDLAPAAQVAPKIIAASVSMTGQAPAELRLQGLKMSDRLAHPPKKSR
ncbi:MAG: hypothetical protein WDN04_01205 [Rhodospirillales bacterium]